MRAQDVITYKMHLHDACQEKPMQDFFDFWALRDAAARYAMPSNMVGGKEFPWSGEQIAGDMTMTLRMSESYFVGEDVMRLVGAAAKTMPPEILKREDAPSTHGFLIFEKPWMLTDIHSKKMPIRGLVWSTRTVGKKETGPARPGIVVWAMIDIDDRMINEYWMDEKNEDLARLMLEKGVRLSPAVVYTVAFDSYSLEYANNKGWLIVGARSDGADHDFQDNKDGTWIMRDGDRENHVRPEPLTTFLHTLWVFQRQKIAAIERPHLRKTTARSMMRRQLLPNPVSVIQLRAREANGQDSGRSYTLSHRFVVRGHWRRQWYASEQRHRSIYINPFIKGPEKAPLLVREKVNAVVR